ncbi:PREDICTED: riboflavin kinase [Nanorana parkeri]|uniref:riboflavin kinase n=1 Tax=Nanorana parkeri TaxID=125878 RepID=UPI0008546F0A|nr:PREDICTED: riboflavin kinase [Nanorana parkeri]XP_018413754.1 PREDICTED: riboflavin kinase [Nanorana parkeri]
MSSRSQHWQPITGGIWNRLAASPPPYTSCVCKHPRVAPGLEMSQRRACSSRLGSGSAAGGVAASLARPVPSTDGLRSLGGHPVEVIRDIAPVEPAKKKVACGCVMSALPYYCSGEVVKGFGRGSKELGIPTANFPEHVVENLPADLNTGIYYGWGCVGDGEIYKMVMSIGWNPFYKNTKKSVETHIIHQFDDDFYGEILSIVIVGYIRPEKSFTSLDALITAIHSDIEEATKQLDLPEFRKLKEKYFNNSHKIMNGH